MHLRVARVVLRLRIPNHRGLWSATLLRLAGDVTRSDYMYFSFITMATVGYGDVTPEGNLGRALAVIEGLLGQIYLVIAVAVLVSSLGRKRAARR